MPVKVNIGLSKKIGLPDYGSLGASANLELELDSGAVGDPDRFRQQIRHLFGLAKASVEEELNRQQPNGARNGELSNYEPNASMAGKRNGRDATDDHQAQRRLTGRAATQSQIRAIKAIAARRRLDLGPQLELFGVHAVDDLGVQQASELIDQLKGGSVGVGGSR